VFSKHCTAQDVQRCMGTHHSVTEIPIDGTHDLWEQRWRKTIKRVLDNLIALVHSDHITLILLVKNLR